MNTRRNYTAKGTKDKSGRLLETPAERRASDIQDRIFYVLLALAVIEGMIFVLGDGLIWQAVKLVWGVG